MEKSDPLNRYSPEMCARLPTAMSWSIKAAGRNLMDKERAGQVRCALIRTY